MNNLVPSINRFDEANRNLLYGYIRDKIVGPARTSLRRNGSYTTWEEIKVCLIRNHGERLSPETLIDRMRTCRVKTNISDFHNSLSGYLCRLNNFYLINQNLNDDQVDSNKRIALECFKQNLPEPARSVVFSRNPGTLEKAFEIIVQGRYENLGPLNQNKFKTTHNQNSYNTYLNTGRNNNNSNRNFQNTFNRNYNNNTNPVNNSYRGNNYNYNNHNNNNFNSYNSQMSRQNHFNTNNYNNRNQNSNFNNSSSRQTNLNRNSYNPRTNFPNPSGITQRTRNGGNNNNNEMMDVSISENYQNFPQVQRNNYPI